MGNLGPAPCGVTAEPRGKGGTCVLTAMTPLSELLVDVVNSSKTIKGALYRGMNVRASMPKLLSTYGSGMLKLDELVARRYQLDDINTAMPDLREGKNIQAVVEFSTG